MKANPILTYKLLLYYKHTLGIERAAFRDHSSKFVQRLALIRPWGEALLASQTAGAVAPSTTRCPQI